MDTTSKILIVEDNHQDFKIMHRALSKQGFSKIVSVEKGEDALAVLQQDLFNLVVLDTVLPTMDGFEVAEAISKMDIAKPKIIMLTGDIYAVDAVKARQLGADDYCVKTKDASSLIETINGLS